MPRASRSPRPLPSMYLPGRPANLVGVELGSASRTPRTIRRRLTERPALPHSEHRDVRLGRRYSAPRALLMGQGRAGDARSRWTLEFDAAVDGIRRSPTRRVSRWASPADRARFRPRRSTWRWHWQAEEIQEDPREHGIDPDQLVRRSTPRRCRNRWQALLKVLFRGVPNFRRDRRRSIPRPKKAPPAELGRLDYSDGRRARREDLRHPG